MRADADWIVPDWPAPGNVRALSTTRQGGVSTGPFATLNLGEHVGDAAEAVAENRRRLQQEIGAAQPRWLRQVHGTGVAKLEGAPVSEAADAAVTGKRGEACLIMTADCLPVLFADEAGTQVGAAHAGWRGLSTGVLEATLAAMQAAPGEVMAWMGPAIGPRSYEVGEEVRQAFITHSAPAAGAFAPGKVPGKWWCDLYELARQRLEAAGVKAIYGGGFCTSEDRDRFFSFRRDAGQTGRMATLIYME
jgi:YfiH family protein